MKTNLPWDEWFAEAGRIQSSAELAAFADNLFRCDIEHTYDSAVHAVAALAYAGGCLGAHLEGITGFQASHVKFDFLRHWDNIGKKVGMHIVDYDHYLLYPQYVEELPLKSISLDIWLVAQKACADKLNALDTHEYWVHNGDCYARYNQACYSVRQYWADVANGIIPECITVLDDDGNQVTSVKPICVTRPAHTLADKERDYDDRDSPWYDEELTRRKREEFIKMREKECQGSF